MRRELLMKCAATAMSSKLIHQVHFILITWFGFSRITFFLEKILARLYYIPFSQFKTGQTSIFHFFVCFSAKRLLLQDGGWRRVHVGRASASQHDRNQKSSGRISWRFCLGKFRAKLRYVQYNFKLHNCLSFGFSQTNYLNLIIVFPGWRRGFQEDLLLRRIRDAKEAVRQPEDRNAQHRTGNSYFCRSPFWDLE